MRISRDIKDTTDATDARAWHAWPAGKLTVDFSLINYLFLLLGRLNIDFILQIIVIIILFIVEVTSMLDN